MHRQTSNYIHSKWLPQAPHSRRIPLLIRHPRALALKCLRSQIPSPNCRMWTSTSKIYASACRHLPSDSMRSLNAGASAFWRKGMSSVKDWESLLVCLFLLLVPYGVLVISMTDRPCLQRINVSSLNPSPPSPLQPQRIAPSLRANNPRKKR